MTMPAWSGPYLSYQSAYGGESMRAAPDVALRRLLATLERFADSARPVEATLTVYDEQNLALYRATRTDGSSDHDPIAARAAAGQTTSALVAPATSLFGTGESRIFASGSCGDHWQTVWSTQSEDIGFAARWQRMVDFVLAHAGDPPIYWGWSDRREGKARGIPVQTVLRFDTRWMVRGALPGLPLPQGKTSSILLFLDRSSSVLLSLLTPFAAVDGDFAAWERSFCTSLGLDVAQSRWSLVWLPDDDGHRWKVEQGRYRRTDWLPDRQAGAPLPGPWDACLDALLALRVTQGQEEQLRRQLLDLPAGDVACALLHRMGPLKGAPLERGRNLLREMAEPEEGREVLSSAVQALLADPPGSKQIRSLAYGLAPVAGDTWFVELLQPYLTAKKVPTAVLDLIDEMYVFQDCAVAPLERARVLVTTLRRLRLDGAESRRATLRNCLGAVDDGSAWATWVLEAASPGKGYSDGYETWASSVLRRWNARDRVRDPAARAYLAWLPRVTPYTEFVPEPERVEVALDDLQRVELQEAERRWLGAS